MNPFWELDCTKDPEKFIGRSHEITIITQKISTSASVAIRGEKFIGKRALMSYITHSKVGENATFLPIWINLLTFENASVEQFFGFFAETVIDSLPRSDRLDKAHKKITLVQEGKKALHELIQELNGIFNFAKREGLQIIYFFDNFEVIAEIFRNREGAFAALRELVSNPMGHIGIVTSAHQNIWKLSRNADGISILAPVMTDIPLSLMGEVDIRNLIYKPLSETEVSFEDSDISFLTKYAGHHPHFTLLLAGYLYDHKRLGTCVYSEVIEESRTRIYRDFEKIKRRLGSEKFNLLLSAEHISTKSPEVEELCELGHLIRVGASYRPFSLLYEDWLSFCKKHRTIENPYIVGNPVSGKNFYGRKKELNRILPNIGNNDYLIDAEWRMGKTSLLFKIQEELEVNKSEDYYFIPVFVSLMEISESSIWIEIGKSISDVINKRSDLQLSSSVSLIVDDSRQCGWSDLKDGLLNLIDRIHEKTVGIRSLHGGKKLKFVLLIDEAQQINAYSPKTRADMRKLLSQDQSISSHISSIFAGYQIEKITSRTSSPWTNFTQTIFVKGLSDEEVLTLILDPLKTKHFERFQFDRSAVEKISDYGRKLPYDTQVYCSFAFEEMVSRGERIITVEIVDAISSMARQQIFTGTHGLRG